MSARNDVGSALGRWHTPVCAVRVSERHGLGSVVTGELVVHTSGACAGTLLGGAVATTVGELAAAVLADGAPRSLRVTLAESDAVSAGLACAGSATLVAHLLPDATADLLGAALRAGQPVALAAGPGRQVGVLAGFELSRTAGTLDAADEPELARRAQQLLRRGVSATETVDVPSGLAQLDLWVPVPRVLVVGAGAIGQALTAQTRVLGWTLDTATGVGQAQVAVAELTAADVLVLLDHSPDFDTALLACARGPAFAGALGSRHTQAQRRQRLQALGATDADLARVRGPVGLDLGARTPAETAVSIVAEVLASRGDRAGTALGASSGRIGG